MLAIQRWLPTPHDCPKPRGYVSFSNIARDERSERKPPCFHAVKANVRNGQPIPIELELWTTPKPS